MCTFASTEMLTVKICFHVQGQCGETADGEDGEGEDGEAEDGEARDQPPSESEVPSKEDIEGGEAERKEGADESVPPPEKGQVYWCSHKARVHTTYKHPLTVLYSFHRSV